MFRRAGLACVGVVVAIGASGCGGGGGSGYTLSATRSCFDKAGFLTNELANRYLPGTGGNLRVRITKAQQQLLSPGGVKGRQARDYVFLVFGKDPAEATATQAKAVHLAVSSLRSQAVLITPAAVRKGVGVTGNVFYYSATGALTKGERTKVTSCLRS